MQVIIVPITTLRMPRELIPSNSDSNARLVAGYIANRNQVHVYKDCVVVGDAVVRALMFAGFHEIRVHVRELYPIHEYPGDV